MMAAGREAFERAVADYRLTDLEPPAEALAVAAASLDRTGLFLLGEAHGVAQTPLAVLGLVSRLGVRALAFEWSYDELDDVVQPVLSTGTIASDTLWKLRPSAEVFSGDGRFTGPRAPARAPEAVGLLIDIELPDVANGILAPSSGTCWFQGENEVASGELPPADAVIPIGIAHPAVVPQHPLPT